MIGPYLRRAHMRMRDQKDALKFSKDVFEMLSGNLECSPAFTKEKDSDFDASDVAAEMVILANNGAIYNLDAFMAVSEYNTFCTIGSGGDVATGAMRVLYDQLTVSESLKSVVDRACQIACEETLSCGGDLVTIELDIEN